MQKIHVKANRHWMNDPNGFIYYKGKYHLFYQCFPYEARWGRMHWAHVVSDDLVNWEYQGIAVFPSKTDDRDGCFSGSAVEDEGKLYLYYTGVRYLVENPEDINLFLDEQFVSAQMLITSEDGYHFDNIKDKKTIIPVFNNSEIGDARHTRDMKEKSVIVFRETESGIRLQFISWSIMWNYQRRSTLEIRLQMIWQQL